MKFFCEKSSILKEISVAHEIISSKNVLSILSNILIEVSDNKLVIKATDLKVNFESFIPVETEEPGTTTVFCEKFLNILRSLPDEIINFQLKGEFLYITNVDNSINFQLNTINPEKFPEIQDIDNSRYFEFSQKDFIDMITQTIFSVSDDETRYFMNGSFLEKTENKLAMVATDGKRLSYISKIFSGEIPDFTGIIIPPKILMMIKKLASGEGNLYLAVSDKTLYVKFDNQKLSSTLIEGQFPNYNRVIPEKQIFKLIVRKEDFMNALKRVSILAEQRSKRIYLSTEKGRMKLKSEESDIGLAQEEVLCQYEGDSLSFALNYVYLIDPLREMDQELISIHFSEAGKAITLHCEPEKDFFHIVMPMHME
jgi:DNA polymerase-3 subunit beta